MWRKNLRLPKRKPKELQFPTVVAGVYRLPTADDDKFNTTKKKSSSSKSSVTSSSLLNLRKFVRLFQPLAEKTPEALKLRQQLFRSCDANGSGYCSLLDVETFILKTLSKDYGNDEGRMLFRLFKPCFVYAFDAAKIVVKSKAGSENIYNVDEDDFVTQTEFRIFNAYLCIYASMLDAFYRVDGGGDRQQKVNKNHDYSDDEGSNSSKDDGRIDEIEWLASYRELSNYGFVALKEIKNESSATAAFDDMDLTDRGFVVFSEFCAYIQHKEIESKTDIGQLLHKSKAQIPVPQKTAQKQHQNPKPTVVVCEVYQPGKSASNQLLDFIRVFNPLTEKSPDGKKRRVKKFTMADKNRNGYLSFADVDTFIRDALSAKFYQNKATDLYQRYRKCYIKAFYKAKLLKQTNHNKKQGANQKGGDNITFTEFRLFNVFLCLYSAMLDAFSRINENFDNITIDEIIQNYRKVQNYGFVALKSIDSAIYGELDADGSGQISYNEWCAYIINAEVKAGTELGKLMEEQKLGPIVGPPKSQSPLPPEEKNAEEEEKRETIIVCGAYQPGKAASQELMDFLHVFQPVAEKSSEGKALRQKNFNHADQNRNGYISLAETDAFIMYALNSAYSKNKAKALFLCFRKCYIKAFHKAKVLHDPEGDGRLNGTVGEEYVTFSEFRLFNAYLCIYAAMFDAFSRINATSDRIDREEFEKSYSKVQNYGFVALSPVGWRTKKPSAIYSELDADGSGQISYNEWCAYIINAEVKAGTELGKLMEEQNLVLGAIPHCDDLSYGDSYSFEEDESDVSFDEYCIDPAELESFVKEHFINITVASNVTVSNPFIMEGHLNEGLGIETKSSKFLSSSPISSVVIETEEMKSSLSFSQILKDDRYKTSELNVIHFSSSSSSSSSPSYSKLTSDADTSEADVSEYDKYNVQPEQIHKPLCSAEFSKQGSEEQNCGHNRYDVYGTGTSSTTSDHNVTPPSLYDETMEMWEISVMMFFLSKMRNWTRSNELFGNSSPAKTKKRSKNHRILKDSINSSDILETMRENYDRLSELEDKMPDGSSRVDLHLKAMESIHSRCGEDGFQIVYFDDSREDEEIVPAVIVDKMRKKVIVAFRGSQSNNDWMTNFKFAQTRKVNPVFFLGQTKTDSVKDKAFVSKELLNNQPGKLLLHSGFYNAVCGETEKFGMGSKYDFIMRKSLTVLREYPGYKFDITGLSLGGALCQMFSLYAAAETNPLIIKPVTCYSFASPKVGALTYRRAIQVCPTFKLSLSRYLDISISLLV